MVLFGMVKHLLATDQSDHVPYCTCTPLRHMAHKRTDCKRIQPHLSECWSLRFSARTYKPH
jgi:hypothetical protein